MAMRRNLWIM